MAATEDKTSPGSIVGSVDAPQALRGIGAVEAELLQMPKKMKWLNATFRTKVTREASETCNSIAEVFTSSAREKQRGVGSRKKRTAAASHGGSL